MPTNLPAWPGTISVAANSTAVVGTGTAFTTAAQGAVIIAQLSSGAGVFVGQFAADPTDDTHATLMLAPKSAISGASYVLVPVSGAVAQAQRVRTALETLAALPTTAGQIGAATETALADADESGWYQAASGNLIKRTWANVKAQLVAVYTTLTVASQAQAQAGTDNTTGMTPLRTAQAIDARPVRDANLPARLGTILSLPTGVTDLNNLRDSGFYFASQTGTASLPSNNQYYVLQFEQNATQAWAQLAVGASIDSVYMRHQWYTGTWSPWLQIMTADGAAALTGTLTTNGQVAFPATQNAASGVNVLDDYEEGTWSAALQLGGASVGMTILTAPAFYIAIGARVIVDLYFKLSAKGSSTGSATIGGIPFVAVGASKAGIVSFWGGTVGITSLSLYAGGGTATLYLQNAGATATAGLTDANITDSLFVILNVGYNKS